MGKPGDRVDDALSRVELRLSMQGGAAPGHPARLGAATRYWRGVSYRLLRWHFKSLGEAVANLVVALRAEQGERMAADAWHGFQHTSATPVDADPAALREALTAFVEMPPSEPDVLSLPPVTSVETDVGALYISALDEAILHHLRRDGTWDPSEGAAIAQLVQPGMTALDVGAHVGYRTVQLARLVGPAGRVIAVEASPANFALLLANIRRHDLHNVFPVHLAAGDREDRVDLALSDTNTGDNHLLPAPGEPSARVAMARLDDILPEHLNIDLVKCDVQGSERLAMAGLERTLRRCRPAVIVEFSPRDIRSAGSEPAEVLGYYRSLGYTPGQVGEAGTEVATDGNLTAAAEGAEHGYLNLLLRADIR